MKSVGSVPPSLSQSLGLYKITRASLNQENKIPEAGIFHIGSRICIKSFIPIIPVSKASHDLLVPRVGELENKQKFNMNSAQNW